MMGVKCWALMNSFIMCSFYIFMCFFYINI